jgi:hypothetical protein
MHDEMLIIWSVVIIALLFGFLYERRWRLRCRQLRERAAAGHGIEVGPMSGRIQAVRQDYAAEVRAHPKQADKHGELVTAARRLVSRCAYFREREPEFTDHPAGLAH